MSNNVGLKYPILLAPNGMLAAFTAALTVTGESLSSAPVHVKPVRDACFKDAGNDRLKWLPYC